MSLEDELVVQIRQQLENNQLLLPSQPEIMQRINRIINDPGISPLKLAQTINMDTALAAHILKVANSPLYHGHQQISNMQQAVSRLGYKVITILVNSYALNQVFLKPNSIYHVFFRNLYQHSLTVAANAYVLASLYPHINREDAMQTGLLHDIGYLPVVQLAQYFPHLTSQQLLDGIRKLHTEIGEMILSLWQFPPRIIEAVSLHEKLQYRGSEQVDLNDLLIAANLLTLKTSPLNPLNKKLIPAIIKLDIDPDLPLEEQKTLAVEMEKAHHLLSLD